MMDDAERAYDGGLQKYALGGAVDDTVLGGAVKDTTPLMDEKVNMYGTNRQQDEMRKQMMYANRMPSIIGT
jgi:tRNA nucleotidyltransferase/poly(A) polymerase